MAEGIGAFKISSAQRDEAIAAYGTLLKQRVSLQQALRQQQTGLESGQEAMYLELLEVVDALDAMLEHLEGTDEPNLALMKRLPRSLGSVRRKLMGVMEARQVQTVELPVGPPDYRICRVVDKELRADLEDQTVTKVVRKGYRLGEKLLRPIEVIVSQRP